MWKAFNSGDNGVCLDGYVKREDEEFGGILVFLQTTTNMSERRFFCD